MARPSRAACLLVATLVASARANAGHAWMPADEYARLHGAAADDPRLRGAAADDPIDADLRRSVAQFAPRTTVQETSALLARLMQPDLRDNAVFVLGGKVFATRRFLRQGEKNQGLCVTLRSAVKRGPLPNVAFAHLSGATGGDADHHFLKGEENGVPTTVIAKRGGYAQRGILLPNPYFGAGRVGTGGDLDRWQSQTTALRRAAAKRAFSKRIPRVFWRGTCDNHEGLPSLVGRRVPTPARRRLVDTEKRPRRRLMDTEKRRRKTCSQENGNRARLLAASLTLARPDVFDAKCNHLAPPKNFTCREGAARAELEAAYASVSSKPRAAMDTRWVAPEDYADFRYVLNLPGQTSGSYSRNLNHLWATGGVVLLWDEPIVEWYYPLLETGVTHLVVNRSTAKKVIKRLETNKKEYKRLAAGAARIADYVMSAGGMANYFDHVLEAVRRHLRYDLVLDDRRALLELLERKWSKEASGESGPGACDRLVEFKVTSRTLRMRHPTGPAREVWDVVERRRNICETLRGMK
mmetsp:Transcript_30158/g.93306  ORF Transcript_30158/g.93306 Transcript_30158/m.93306 type:complete len:524 (-) Transcript_30158:75-1646(-)